MGRRRKRFLTPQEKYEIWLQLLRKEATIAEAAQRAGVDPATVMNAWSPSRTPSTPWPVPVRGYGPRGWNPELAAARAEIERLSKALTEMGCRLMLMEGKGPWD